MQCLPGRRKASPLLRDRLCLPCLVDPSRYGWLHSRGVPFGLRIVDGAMLQAQIRAPTISTAMPSLLACQRMARNTRTCWRSIVLHLQAWNRQPLPLIRPRGRCARPGCNPPCSHGWTPTEPASQTASGSPKLPRQTISSLTTSSSVNGGVWEAAQPSSSC